MKKNAGIVEDSIDAEELGRFPDSDVADSLEHLPGITITRTTGGEGQKVSVRGFGPQYNIVTLNNRILATDDDGRDLAFDVLPSEVISGADVLKSSEASALEGSIGGTVNLRTASPFENPGSARRRARRGQLQRHVHAVWQEVLGLCRGHGVRQHAGVPGRGRDLEQPDPHRFAECLQPEHLRSDDSLDDGQGATCRSRSRPAASPSGRSSTTRSARPCPGVSSGARPIRSTWSRTACGRSSRIPRSAITSRITTPYARSERQSDLVEPDGQQRARHGGDLEQLHARDRQQHDRPQRRHFALRSEGQLEGQRQVQVDLRWLSLRREPARGRRRHVRDGGPGLEPRRTRRTSSPPPTPPHSLPSLNVMIPPGQLGLSACPAGHGEQDQGGLLLLYGTDEFGRPQQQQLLVHPLRRTQRLFGARPDHRLHAGRRLAMSTWDPSRSCCSVPATTIARRPASTTATTGPTAPASTARCITRRAARSSARPIRSARKASTSSPSPVRRIS